ncbi:hypothetical protein DFH09DRAFT_1272770 [Mycena vulgaris]|nr:hypothetical protein DFH09DRAFT_1272770 [Mycena vulgaris]
MPPSTLDTRTRSDRTITWLNAAVDSLGILCDTFKTPFLQAMCITTRSLLSSVQTAKKNKNECIELMELIHEVVYVIIDLHIKSGGEEFPPSILNQMGEFTEIHLIPEVINMGEYAQKRHEEVLELIQTLSDTIITGFSGSQNSSNSLSLLPSEPKIFHGRESEVSDILSLFHQEPPRIAILGAGGMGKTSLARAVLHHVEIASRYDQHRFFIACDAVSTKSELVALIGIHLGIKPDKDLTRNILRHLSSSPASLLILDNLETSWELLESRRDIEGLLSLLADIHHLALIITMRGAERPGNVRWTRPFLPPLEPLSQDAARQTFIDIAEDIHDSSEIDRVLSLTGNMPLAIDLISHMVDTEGCTNILDRWEAERTSLISEGHDRRSNLDLSISLSLSSPRITSLPQSKDLLSLLSMLPDGLSDIELLKSNLPMQDILGCKAALLRTSLAYKELGRVKTLVPIREYMQKSRPPTSHLIHPLLKQFYQLLQGERRSPTHELVTRIRSNFANIQSILQYSLQQEDTELVNTIYSIIHFMVFCQDIGHHQLQITLRDQILPYLPKCSDHELELHYITALFTAWAECHIPNPAALIDQGEFYQSVSNYYLQHDNNIPAALNFLQIALTLAISCGNIKAQSTALYKLARAYSILGDHSKGQLHASESQRLAKLCTDFYTEARAVYIQIICWYSLGNFAHAMCLCREARNLLDLCGLSDSAVGYAVMSAEANLHAAKSEYTEARNVYMKILERNSLEGAPYQHGLALLNVTALDTSCAAPSAVVQPKLHTVKSIFSNMNHIRLVMWCDLFQADLDLREGNSSVAKSTFEECLNSARGKADEQMAYCLERLGNVRSWGSTRVMSGWTVVFLAHSLKLSKRLAIYKALQFLGDVFSDLNDQDTAISLFTVALEGFTLMDIHHNRAECMLRLGDMAQERGDLAQAAVFWTDARPLFERSSQIRDIHQVDERLSALEKNPREGLGHLIDINAFTASPAEHLIGEEIGPSQIIKLANQTKDDGDKVPISM